MSFLRLFSTFALLAVLGACVSGMGEAYSTLPNTFDDLGAQSKAIREGRTAQPVNPADAGFSQTN